MVSIRILSVASLAILNASAWATPPRAAIVTSDLPGHSSALIASLTSVLEKEHYKVEPTPLESLYDADRLIANRPDVLVLPNAAVIPVRVAASIEKYLRTGGDLIALRTPLSANAMIRVDGRWTTKEAHLRETATTPPAHMLYDLSAGLRGWQRSSNHPEFAITTTPVRGEPAAGMHAVHVQLSDLDGWDTQITTVPPGCFRDGDTLTVLSAKGSDTTQHLAIEWEEKDGSRWIAAVPLGRQWQRFVLAPEQFKYWQSNPSRGQGNDKFNPANAVNLKIGLAHSHTGAVNGKQEYWLGPIGTGPRTSEMADLVGDASLPMLDTICPSYKLFECSEVATLTCAPGFAPSSPAGHMSPPNTAAMRSPHPRAAGGFDKGRQWRFLPLIEAQTADGQWRGNPAMLLIHADGPYKGGVWASFGIDDETWYTGPDAQRLLNFTLAHLRRKVFVLDGGTDKFTYFDGQPIRMGVRVVNLGKGPIDGRVLVTLSGRNNTSTVRKADWAVHLGPGEAKTLTDTWLPADWPVAGFSCEASLTIGDEYRDVVSNQAHVWRPSASKHFVTARDGRFMLDGKRWRAHGINYMPSSGIGSEDYDYFENWTGPRAYDPTVIDRDLGHVKALGYNAVSVFTHHKDRESLNIIDLIRRCDELGLKVNLFLRPSSPRDYDFKPIREMIEDLRLAENDTVFAYDIDWEPLWGRHNERVRWDREWEAWIVERYGNIAAAEKDWGFALPRDAAGKITNPLHEHIVKDGDWRRMVAAYRRFLDTLQYQKYANARTLIRGVDPNHLVSFRMTQAGDPTCAWDDILPYDFPYLVNAVDFLAPEAYGRIGDWERVKPGWFQREYARWADPAKPMIWAEQGMSTSYLGLCVPSPSLLDKQAAFYRDFYRMMIASGADGIFSWWYAGGYRCYENSDYGIINPDGSDRPVTKVIREMGPQFINGPDLKPVDTWIEFDRDQSATGIAGAYNAVKDEFWKAIAAGTTPGLRTAGTGSDSRTCAPVAVGNTPCNGANPPKYLDAVFDTVEIRDQNGKWVEVTKGTSVAVQSTAKPVAIRVRLTNLGEAKWIANDAEPGSPEAVGGVYLAVTSDGTPTYSPLSRDVPHREVLEPADLSVVLPDRGSVKVELRMSVAGRGAFGERFSFTLSPRAAVP
jgi:hypothetical protein